ncbi:tRNA pseudouridine synthase A [Polaribacter huanghezhanensis]|uniref:tRNA pseudouridine(38-40) synthase TruA n=1 Tax=Polaribacter huanghezhanensis TaxID=1354726 RepID=UPI002647873F|nr:tRNA pseudouridine(38-40) synthase TruA [Polaribacter huanghezhanensis]WKD86027.1 tRNA pseudouridine synthase A [Polaribacter huanghezhanensis]
MRYFIELSYLGKNYHGWQVQPDANSIQEELNKAISTVLQEEISVVGAGRTDTGVHASQMFAHFDSETILDKNIVFKLNSMLPEDIVVHHVVKVAEEKHARFDALTRSYKYRIWLGRNPFLLETTWQLFHQKLDVDAMNEAAEILLEYENFQAFSKVKTEVKTFNCKVTKAVWIQEGNQLIFHITANRFLRNMVRAIVGTLVDVGKNKINKEDFRTIILSKDRANAGLSVPAKGLFLTEITY